MRRLSRLGIALVILTLALTHPSVACPWDPPTDPCMSAAELKDAFEARIAARASAVPDNDKEVGEQIDVRPLTCEEIIEHLSDPDPERRLAVLEGLATYGYRLDECALATDSLEQILGHDPEPFLVLRALAAVHMQDTRVEHQNALVRLLEHGSPDVRRHAATLLQGNLEPKLVEQVVSALGREKDPWVLLALVQLDLEGHEPATRVVLERLVQQGGPASAAALAVLSRHGDSLDPVLRAFHRQSSLRSAALDLLWRRGDALTAQSLFLEVLQQGSEIERIQAAVGLLRDEAAAHWQPWRQLVMGPELSLRSRAVLVLHASYREPWRSIACEVKRADPELAAEVTHLLADETYLYDVMYSWRPNAWSLTPTGWIQPASGTASVRCASRPFGPPRSGQPRIRAGTLFGSAHRFVQEGVAWLAEFHGTCWVPADVVVRERPEVDDAAALETDLSREALLGIDAALAAGDLQVFDEASGHVGVRLRNPTSNQRKQWNAGSRGKSAVLASIEAQARQREAERERPLSSAQNR